MIINCNIKVENRDSYFKKQWRSLLSQQTKNVMTDVSLVGTKEGGFSAVKVKKLYFALRHSGNTVLTLTHKHAKPSNHGIALALVYPERKSKSISLISRSFQKSRGPFNSYVTGW